MIRNRSDERNLVISLTEAGNALKDKAVDVPASIAQTIHLEPEEAMYLYSILYRILEEE